MALQSPIVYGRMPQVVKGKIINPCPFAGRAKAPLHLCYEMLLK
jgi:hypothetical protein